MATQASFASACLYALTRGLCGGPPLLFHPQRLLLFGPPLCINTICLHPFQSLRLGPTPCNRPGPHLLPPHFPTLFLDPNGYFMGLDTLCVLGGQPLLSAVPPPDSDRGRRIRIMFVVCRMSPHYLCVYLPSVTRFLPFRRSKNLLVNISRNCFL